jgi:hypothetical protein
VVNLSCIESFIKRKLQRKLEDDLVKFRIVREADLQSCIYLHLRSYLARDSQWRIYSEKHVPQTHRFVDLLICQECKEGYKPRLAIELKWNRKRISEKDRRSLCYALKDLKVHKAYFITTNYTDSKYQRIKKTRHERYKLYEIEIRLPQTGNKNDWRKKRDGIKDLVYLSQRKV